MAPERPPVTAFKAPLYVAWEIFSRFRGRWEVRQVMENVAATAFWRSVIGQYTSGAFEETLFDDERWRGPVQRFDNRASTGAER